MVNSRCKPSYKKTSWKGSKSLIFQMIKLKSFVHGKRFRYLFRCSCTGYKVVNLSWVNMNIFTLKHRNRGYNITAWRYEISLWVLKNISRVSGANEWNIFQHEWNTKPFYFRCERRNFLCSHSNGVIFTCENNMLSSRVKISRFPAKAHLVFHCCLYNKEFYLIWDVDAHKNQFQLTFSQAKTLKCSKILMEFIPLTPNHMLLWKP